MFSLLLDVRADQAKTRDLMEEEIGGPAMSVIMERSAGLPRQSWSEFSRRLARVSSESHIPKTGKRIALYLTLRRAKKQLMYCRDYNLRNACGFRNPLAPTLLAIPSAVHRFAMRSSRQAKAAAGNLALSKLRDSNNAFWPRTVWTTEAAMKSFMLSGPHRRAMPRLLEWCDEAAMVRWIQESEREPIGKKRTVVYKRKADGLK